MTLDQQKAQPLPPGSPPLPPEEILSLAQQLPDWQVKWDAIERDYTFPDFDQAITFVNRVADVARQEDHHPDIAVSYNKVHVHLATHSVGGLSRNDFIVAAKINQLA